jgi:hypothetical protein
MPFEGVREPTSPGKLNEPGIRPEPVREVPTLLWEQDPDVLRILGNSCKSSPRKVQDLKRWQLCRKLHPDT